MLILATNCMIYSSQQSLTGEQHSISRNTYYQPIYTQQPIDRPIIQQRQIAPNHDVADPECDCIAAGAVSLGLQAVGPALLGCGAPPVITISVSLSTFALGAAIMRHAIEILQREY